MNRRVVITGLGVISSIGTGWEAFWDSLIKGKSGISPVTAFDTSNHFTHNGGEIKNFAPGDFIPAEQLIFMNRATQMALAATHGALKDAALAPDMLAKYSVGVSHGTTLGSAQTIEDIDIMLVDNRELNPALFYKIPTYAPMAVISKELGLQGVNFMFSTACAAGNYAIAYGHDLIKMNRADIVIAGAADPMSRIEFTGFNQFSAVAPEKCQPFDKNRKGMMLAEGAGILILESLDRALERNTSIYAEILGYGLSCDAYHMTTASVDGIAACMINALNQTAIEPDKVDYISAHGTGTVANDKAETAAIKKVFGPRYKNIPVSSIKSMIGHTMGAASALEAIACALTVKHDIIPPTINFETPDQECDIDCVPNEARKQRVTIALNNSYAFGGNNASLVIKKYIAEGNG